MEVPRRELNRLDKIINSGLSLIHSISTTISDVGANAAHSIKSLFHIATPYNADTEPTCKVPDLTKNKYGRKLRIYSNLPTVVFSLLIL